MSSYVKFRFCQAITFLGLGGLAFCLRKLIEAGWGGGYVIQWFIALIITLVISLPFGIATYYYRSKSKNETVGEAIAVEALAAAAHIKPAQPDVDQPADPADPIAKS